ncbi:MULTISPECIES: GNAT family N-acetyltransferase [Rhodopseudomonas]|uniref:GNAT family acetyltransferase n=1 Tax=Rhodopseudomonas palustris TaxID=1076 RepID=A0A0D7EPB1_RHOPL|nr:MULTISPECIES: GNAT family N-acetyltransferase [Rhodopseudomonas]KIZ42385.1 GNAT family acetyltransferase [Rhodopseudomonas palustris]MDF3814364.1 GNAT family N-acetyltransferase [Rhodopseudomonas sp. BAL398]WOK18058.1 GNAT family N-acetyltransferase [Rhodopseudomonas sp. BAL398]
MLALNLADLGRYTDVVLLRTGAELSLRFAEPADAAALRDYFRSLSAGSRYNRLMGAAPELPQTQLDKFVRAGDGGSYSVLATVARGEDDAIIGEVRYAYHSEAASVEFGVSVADRWHGHGIGTALLSNLQCRAAALGAVRLFGDTLRSNGATLGLARKMGFAFSHFPGDWKQVRLEKAIAFAPQQIPCASWRLAATGEARPR